MKAVLPLLLISTAFASCSTPYKSGQTPDDVYYSPARARTEYVERDEERPQPKESVTVEEDRYLRMRVRNRQRWSEVDDYYRDPYAYSYRSCNCACEANPRLSWGYYYSPYSTYSPVAYRPVVPNTPRRFNFNDWQPPTPAPVPGVVQPDMKPGYATPVYSETDNGSSRGSTLRNTYNNPPANPSTNSGSNSSNSSSTTPAPAPRNAGVRKF